MEITPEQWEAHVKEELAGSDEMQLLDLTQDCAIKLAATLGDQKAGLRNGEGIDYILRSELTRRIARMAVMLDVLQLCYSDAAEEEYAFLKHIEGCLN